MSTSTHSFKIAGRSARALIIGPPGTPAEESGRYPTRTLTALLRNSSPWPTNFDSPHTFAGNWAEPEFVVERDPLVMRHLQVSDWLKTPRWAQDGKPILMDAVLAIAALVLMYSLGALLPLGPMAQLLIPIAVTGIGLYLLITWQGRIAWKQALTAAQPALEWRAAHADSVRYIGNLPAAEAERLAQIRKTPGIGHHDIWDCVLLLQEEAPLTAFISEYSRFYSPQNANTELVEALGAKLKAARSRVQQIDNEIRTKTSNAAAIRAAINDEITEEERASRRAHSS